MSARRIAESLAALVIGVLVGACATTAASSAPVTVSCTRIIEYPAWLVRAAVPDALAELGVGRPSYAAVGRIDTFQADTEAGMKVSISAQATSERITVLKVWVAGTEPTATWLVNAVPDAVNQHAYTLEPSLSQLGYISGESKE